MIFIQNRRIAAILIIIGFLISGNWLYAQKLVLMDCNDGNRIVNDGVITVDTTDLSTLELSAHLKIQNNTDKTLAIFMKKINHQVVDSTSNYFCLYPKCWPDADSTDIADSIPAGLIDSSFVTHYDHFYRFEKPIPPGFTSITYFFYDHTTFPEPVEAWVTINYLISGVGISELKTCLISAYPVPAKDLVTFSFPGSISDAVTQLEVYDLSGKRILDLSINDDAREYMLDVSGIEDGAYLAISRTRSGKTGYSKIIIGHQ
jgi:hypothetical protein